MARDRQEKDLIDRLIELERRVKALERERRTPPIP